MAMGGETPQIKNEQDVMKKAADRMVTADEAKDINDFLAKTPDILNNNEIFNTAVMKGINALLNAIQITPDDCIKAKEGLLHYKKLAQYLNKTNKVWEGVYLPKIEKKDAELQLRLQDQEFMTKGPKILDQAWFLSNTSRAQEVKLGKGMKLQTLSKEESIADYTQKCERVVGKSFNGKKASEVRSADIFALNPDEKALLAYKLTVLAPTTENEYGRLESQNLLDKISFISKPSDTEKKNIRQIFAGERNRKMITTYQSFFKPGEKIPEIKKSFTAENIVSPEEKVMEKNQPDLTKTDYKRFAFTFRPTTK